ncbi:hypothetical protein [Nocardioides convexus]|uniref:hypothetical protein n=1 Tax=Nocardioides convexus TaxID=2712224 RepID=UPI0024182FB0|nr:hypothetical protein [Nocardioides convexus]
MTRIEVREGGEPGVHDDRRRSGPGRLHGGARPAAHHDRAQALHRGGRTRAPRLPLPDRLRPGHGALRPPDHRRA